MYRWTLNCYAFYQGLVVLAHYALLSYMKYTTDVGAS